MESSELSYEEITQAALRAARREVRRQLIRRTRSHNWKYFSAELTAATPPEWENPCGGTYLPTEGQSMDDSSAQGRVIKRKYLRQLRDIIYTEYQETTSIAKRDYGDFGHWQREYTFLPNMTLHSSRIKLKTWYRHMQTFVGSFAYLGRAHYTYRKQQQLSLGETAHELHTLLDSAKRLLCEIETAINSSYPNSNGAKLSHVSREEMLERLKFRTPADGSKETDESDLKFSKQLYFQYVYNMWRKLSITLRNQHRSSKERKQHASHASTSSKVGAGSASSGSSMQALSQESRELFARRCVDC
ncbi:uncharacterized protein LOC108605358 [Drosophila busckii]|uniref:uncharacterized protein LOC108605358 n=1 Tax=Drosophila busckii TaxID=30019 RepID=UPI00083F340F|nr:uncharacterized protein LOC108605358 [Drosophila busckii]